FVIGEPEVKIKIQLFEKSLGTLQVPDWQIDIDLFGHFLLPPDVRTSTGSLSQADRPRCLQAGSQLCQLIACLAPPFMKPHVFMRLAIRLAPVQSSRGIAGGAVAQSLEGNNCGHE